MNARKLAIIMGVCYLTANIIAGPLGLALTEPALVLQPYLWRFVNCAIGGLRWPLEPSAPIVTATRLLPSGASPSRPSQA
jgi:hypothetical protein